jgi:3'(2'), 5'-bisphosphate nucleotidase
LSKLDATACAGLMEAATAIAVHAALAIREEARKGGVQHKADGSPVTNADLAAEAVIRSGLMRLAPALPIISEEQAAPPQSLPRDADYFLVDPLDGTREFIAGHDEYAVCIALMAGGAPVLGVIAAPAQGLIWRGIVGRGADRLAFAPDGTRSPAVPIHTRSQPQGELVVLVSRSHLEPRTQAFLDGLPKARAIPCGSAVKFCRVADGSADLYPRLAPTRDWDVAAGHALVEAAGGQLLTPDGALLAYGTPDLRIPGFIARAIPTKT